MCTNTYNHEHNYMLLLLLLIRLPSHRKLKTWWKKYAYKRGASVEDDNDNKNLRVKTTWERDYNLATFENLHLLDEYLEMGEHLTVLRRTSSSFMIVELIK